MIALQDRNQSVAILVAARDLPIGSVLRIQSVTQAALPSDSSLARVLIPADQLQTRTGWLIERAVRAGEPLRWSDLRDATASDGSRAMSIPIDPEHAVAGSVRVGDVVDVIAVYDGTARWVLVGAPVIEVGDVSSRDGIGGTRPYTVTVSVNEQAALRLAWAVRDATVEVVRATGAPPIDAAGFWSFTDRAPGHASGRDAEGEPS